MSGKEDHFTIPDCPLCKGSHTYILRVKRSLVFTHVIMNNIHEKPRSVHITRFFPCPVNQEDFQAEIEFQETSRSGIESVKVIGLVEEPSDG